MKALLYGMLALGAVASLAASTRLLGRGWRRGERDDLGMTEQDVARFVNEGGAPVGAGAE